MVKYQRSWRTIGKTIGKTTGKTSWCLKMEIAKSWESSSINWRTTKSSWNNLWTYPVEYRYRGRKSGGPQSQAWTVRGRIHCSTITLWSAHLRLITRHPGRICIDWIGAVASHYSDMAQTWSMGRCLGVWVIESFDTTHLPKGFATVLETYVHNYIIIAIYIIHIHGYSCMYKYT